jgi:hypothetical protein
MREAQSMGWGSANAGCVDRRVTQFHAWLLTNKTHPDGGPVSNIPFASSQQGTVQPPAMTATTPAATPAILLDPTVGLLQADVDQPVQGSDLKRKAVPSERCPSEAKRSRTRAALREGGRGWRPLERPEEGSLNARLHARPGERLFVHPFAWTRKQLELLQFGFRRAEPPSEEQRDGRDGCSTAAQLGEPEWPQDAPGDDVKHFVKDLGSRTLEGQKLGVKGLLALFRMQWMGQELRLRYVILQRSCWGNQC